MWHSKKSEASDERNFALPLSIPDGLADVFGFHGIGVRQIRDGARHFAYAVVRAAREAETVDRIEGERRRGTGKSARIQIFRRHGGIGFYRISETLRLAFSCRDRAYEDFGAGRSSRFGSDFRGGQTGDSDEEVDAVEYGSGHPVSIPFECRRRADAGFFTISGISARTGVRCREQLEPRRIRMASKRSRNADFAVFERLA